MIIEYVVVDLDGTLLNEKKEIGEYTLERMKKLHSKKMHIVLASGRHYRDIYPYAVTLEMKYGDYIICCDGQYIYDCRGKLLWHNSFLDFTSIKYITEKISCEEYFVFTNNTDFIVVNNIAVLLKRYFLISTIKRKSNMVVLRKLKNLESVPIEKIRFHSKDVSPEQCDEFSTLYSVHKIGVKWVDITEKSTNKYESLKKLLRLIDMDFSKTVYFGDDDNDIECFMNLPYCIAMDNATAKIKQYAWFITKSNKLDGVGHALDQIIGK